MKIIKIFEDFKTEDYYVEIETFPSDKHSYTIDRKETKRLFNYITNDLSPYTDAIIDCELTYTDEIHIQGKNHTYVPVLVLCYVDIWILCAEDQYYYVRYDDGSKEPYGYFYKCDQFEGLLMLLKDKNMI
jgi:hypothetical protein